MIITSLSGPPSQRFDDIRAHIANLIGSEDGAKGRHRVVAARGHRLHRRAQLFQADERRANALDGLAAAAPFVRRQLGGVMRVRRVPELEFLQDKSLAHAKRIEELLREVRRDDDATSEEGKGEADPEESEE